MDNLSLNNPVQANPIQEKIRNSSLELLRIIAMVMIVFHHFAIHGGFDFTYAGITIPRLWYNFIIMGGKIGVDVFVMISGYFLITKDTLSLDLRRFVKLWKELLFYALVLFLILKGLKYPAANKDLFFRSIFPLTDNLWWFATTYGQLCLIYPLLNHGLKAMSKIDFQKLLIGLFFLLSVIPTISTVRLWESNLLWFIFLYCSAAYIRLYGLTPKLKLRHYVIALLVVGLFSYISTIVFSLLAIKQEIYKKYIIYFSGQNMITTYIISISLLMIFQSLKLNYNKWINICSSATFGVYLLHDHPLSRVILWKEIFRNAEYQNTVMLIPYSIIVVAFVFCTFTIIDFVRQKLFDSILMKPIDYGIERVVGLLQVKSKK